MKEKQVGKKEEGESVNWGKGEEVAEIQIPTGCWLPRKFTRFNTGVLSMLW